MKPKFLAAAAVVAIFCAGEASAGVITSVANFNSLDPTDVYTIAIMAEDVESFIDRRHQYNGVTGAGMPSFLLGEDFVMVANDDKNSATLRIEVTVGANATLFLFIDNRVGDNNAGDPPTLGGGVMDWVLNNGFVDTGLDIGIDETGTGTGLGVGAGVSIDNTSSIFSLDVLAGTTSTFEQFNSNLRNMYGIAAVATPTPVPEPSTLALFATGLAGLGFFMRRRRRVA